MATAELTREATQNQVMTIASTAGESMKSPRITASFCPGPHPNATAR